MNGEETMNSTSVTGYASLILILSGYAESVKLPIVFTRDELPIGDGIATRAALQ